MHSRIIELGNAPILPDDRMGECSVPEWFYHSIADYTNAETDRDEDLKWFLEIVAHIVMSLRMERALRSSRMPRRSTSTDSTTPSWIKRES